MSETSALTAVFRDHGKRIPGIDLAEALAILMVVVYHISLCSYRLFEDPAIDTAITYYLRCFLVTCVPLFLTVNGYLMLRHDLDLKKHTIRILRLFLVTLLWGVAPMLIQMGIDGRSLTLLDFWKELLTFSGPVIHLWYMGALLCIYLFFPIIKLAYDENRQLFLFFLAFSAAVTFGNRIFNQIETVIDAIGGAWYYAEPRNNWFSIFNPYNAVYGYTYVYFCLGGLLPDLFGWLEKHFPKRRDANLFLLACLIAASIVHALWFLFLYHKRNYYLCPVWYGYNSMSALVMTISLLMLCFNDQGRHRSVNRICRTVSENTLGIYFMHMLFVLPLKPVLKASVHWLCNLPGNVLVGLAIVAVCTVLSVLLKKLPGLRWLVQ